jgi:nicotinamide-nucleotide amidase
MAAGARKITTPQGHAETSWGVGTTGIAGPNTQDGKPVGTVYIGIASDGGSRGYGPFDFPGTGGMVREATIKEALTLLQSVLLSEQARDG